jgi:uncharacterized membrane protein
MQPPRTAFGILNAMPNTHHGGAEHPAVKVGNPMAIFAYLWILILIPFLTDAKKDSFVKYHLKQGLALIIFEVIGWVAGWILVFIPIIGWLIMWLWWLATLVLAVLGIINVLNGHEKELPVIGKYGASFKF